MSWVGMKSLLLSVLSTSSGAVEVKVELLGPQTRRHKVKIPNGRLACVPRMRIWAAKARKDAVVYMRWTKRLLSHCRLSALAHTIAQGTQTPAWEQNLACMGRNRS